jgi:hypothetical protein
MAVAFYASGVGVVWKVIVAVVLATLAGACTSDDNGQPSVGAADVYTALVDWQVGQAGPPVTGAPLPVVYIATENGTTIDPSTQAKVAQNTVDAAKVRFADNKDDAIDADVDGAPVKDDGVLLVVDEFTGKDTTVLVVPVTVYHDSSDEQRLMVTVRSSDGEVAVTSSSVRPSG